MRNWGKEKFGIVLKQLAGIPFALLHRTTTKHSELGQTVFQLQPRPVQSSCVQGSVAERAGYSTIPPEKLTGAQYVNKCLVYNTTRMYNPTNRQGRQKRTIQWQHNHLPHIMSLDPASNKSNTQPLRNILILSSHLRRNVPKWPFRNSRLKFGTGLHFSGLPHATWLAGSY